MGITYNEFWQILNNCWLILDVIFIHLFLSAFFSCKVSKTRYYLVLLVVWCLSLVISRLPVPSIVVQSIPFMFHSVAAQLLYTGKLRWQAFAVATAMVLGELLYSVPANIVSLIMGISASQFEWHFLLYTMISLLSKTVCILAAWIVYHYRKNRDIAYTQHKWVVLSLLLPAVSYSMLTIVYNGYYAEHDALPSEVLVFTVFLVVANLVNLHMVHTMVKQEREMREAALLKQQTEIQTESILALEKNYRAQRKSVHEYKHQLQTIHDLLESGQEQSALAYVKQLQGMQTTRILAVNSHHPIIDAILNHKYQLAKDQLIDVQVQVNDLSGVTLGADSLVVLLTNLWDNAIEACCRLPNNRIIQCNLVANDALFLSIRNTSLPVTITDNTIPTSKEPKHEHGFGLVRIQHILDQFGAEYTFTYEDSWFQFVAEIPLNKL